MYLAIISPKPEDLRIVGAFARTAVSARMMEGCFACQEVLKLSLIMGAVSDANPSIEGAVAKMQNSFLSS